MSSTSINYPADVIIQFNGFMAGVDLVTGTLCMFLAISSCKQQNQDNIILPIYSKFLVSESLVLIMFGLVHILAFDCLKEPTADYYCRLGYYSYIYNALYWHVIPLLVIMCQSSLSQASLWDSATISFCIWLLYGPASFIACYLSYFAQQVSIMKEVWLSATGFLVLCFLFAVVGILPARKTSIPFLWNGLLLSSCAFSCGLVFFVLSDSGNWKLAILYISGAGICFAFPVLSLTMLYTFRRDTQYWRRELAHSEDNTPLGTTLSAPLLNTVARHAFDGVRFRHRLGMIDFTRVKFGKCIGKGRSKLDVVCML
jgi:hypothetical protein